MAFKSIGALFSLFRPVWCIHRRYTLCGSQRAEWAIVSGFEIVFGKRHGLHPVGPRANKSTHSSCVVQKRMPPLSSILCDASFRIHESRCRDRTISTSAQPTVEGAKIPSLLSLYVCISFPLEFVVKEVVEHLESFQNIFWMPLFSIRWCRRRRNKVSNFRGGLGIGLSG